MNKKPFIFGIVCFLVIAAVIAGIIYAIFQAIKDDAKETVLAPEPREGLTKMYVFGGWQAGIPDDAVMSDGERYDPVSDTWTAVKPMSTARVSHTVGGVTEDDGRYFLYAVGGWNDGSASLRVVEKYDLTNDIWEDVEPMLEERKEHAVGVVTHSNDQKQYLYAVGGVVQSQYSTLSVLKYNHTTDSWGAVANMQTARKRLGVGVVTHSNDQKQYMYAVGGYNSSNRQLQSVERYDPTNDTWTQVAPISEKREGLAVGVLTEADGEQYLYAVGGYDGINFLDSVERYDPRNDVWTQVQSMATERRQHTVGVVTESDGRQYLYAAGGWNYDESTTTTHTLATVERYDPDKNSWTPVAPMSKERFGLARTLILGPE